MTATGAPPVSLQPPADERICVLYVIWSLQMGGAERVVADLARSLDRRRFRPLVCCLNFKGSLAEGLEAAGIPVFALDKGKGLDLRVLPRLVRLMREERVDVVHTHLWTSSFWGRLAAAPGAGERAGGHRAQPRHLAAAPPPPRRPVARHCHR